MLFFISCNYFFEIVFARVIIVLSRRAFSPKKSIRFKGSYVNKMLTLHELIDLNCNNSLCDKSMCNFAFRRARQYEI